MLYVKIKSFIFVAGDLSRPVIRAAEQACACGIGLAIAKATVEAHRGRIMVKY